jgi:hypothetical protein
MGTTGGEQQAFADTLDIADSRNMKKGRMVDRSAGVAFFCKSGVE